MTDQELLQQYVEAGCETSFGELVRRNLNLVFSAAMRQVGGDRQLAEDVTQAVFTAMARKAKSLTRHQLLSAWLYTCTRYEASTRVRAEQRRRQREKEHSFMAISNDAPPEWSQLQPIVDEAMHQLRETDRNALLLRFFEGRAFAEVGARLGLSEDAARMRVDRALDKLRKLLAARGFVSTATVLSGLLAQQTMNAAPLGLAAVISSGAIAGAATSTGTILTLIQTMSMTKLKTGIVAVCLAGATVPFVLQQQALSDVKQQNNALKAQNEQLVAKVAALPPPAANEQRPAAQSPTLNEVMRLRAEVTRLRAEARNNSAGLPISTDNAMQDTLVSLAARAARLKQSLAQMPDKAIPELQFLTEKDWLDAVEQFTTLDTEEQTRQALNELRARAKGTFGNKLRGALRKFAEANAGMLPPDLAQLATYFDEPIDATILERYQLLRSGSLEETTAGLVADNLVVEIAPPVDEEFDTLIKFNLRGTTTRSYSKVSDLIETAVADYARANDGLLPKDPGQLTSHLQQPIDPARIEKFLSKFPPEITRWEQIPRGR